MQERLVQIPGEFAYFSNRYKQDKERNKENKPSEVRACIFLCMHAYIS